MSVKEKKQKPIFHSVSEERAQELKGKLDSIPVTKDISETFKVLSDPTRVKIIYLLSEQELCVHDLATLLEASQSATSHHLKILRMMHLVKDRKVGRSVYYSLDDEHVLTLFQECLDHVRHK